MAQVEGQNEPRSQHMGVFNVCEILEYLSREQEMVKGKESSRTFKEQKKKRKYLCCQLGISGCQA